MKRQYFSMEQHEQEANINIYGDITSWAWEDLGEVSAVNLSRQIEQLGDVSKINVYINSYGGEVAEGLAIYNSLKRHKAKVVTYCDGFAASIASVIFMAGDERVMNESSLLMIHNAWTFAEGNAEALRKQADDLEKITQASVIAYKSHSSLSEEEIKALMDAETWILPEEALTYGFATKIEKVENTKESQNVRKSLFELIKMYAKQAEEDDDEEEESDDTIDEPNEDVPEDEETSDDSEEPETSDEEDDEPIEENKVNQMLNGFFRAILKI